MQFPHAEAIGSVSDAQASVGIRNKLARRAFNW
jgi:hypothetical protein